FANWINRAVLPLVDRTETEQELRAGIVVVERVTCAIEPVVANFRANVPVAIGLIIQTRGQLVEVPWEKLAKVWIARPQTCDDKALFIAEPFEPQTGRPAAIDFIEEVLVQTVPIRLLQSGGRVGIALHAKVVLQNVGIAAGQIASPHQA